MAPITIHEIVIIESLSARDKLRTGEDLYRELASEKALSVSLRKPVAAVDLFRCVAELTARAARESWVPLVHLEIHGASDKAGLVVASGEFVGWEQFAGWLRDLNIATRNSVLVVLGVCGGLYLSTAAAVSPFEPAPFYGLIGPDRTINSFVMYHGFRAFYRELLTSGDIAKVVDRLRSHSLPEYSGLDTAMLFRRGMEVYDRTQLKGDGLVRRIKKGVRKLPPSEIAKYGGRNKARQGLAQRIREFSAQHRDRYYEHFIMADAFPENADRFPPLGAA
jgi:hypothetical protein